MSDKKSRKDPKPDLFERIADISNEVPLDKKETEEVLEAAGIDSDAAYQRLLKRIKDYDENSASEFMGKATTFHRKGKLNKARDMYGKALMAYEQLGDKQGMADACGYLGLVLSTQGRLEEAETVYKKALGVYDFLGDKEGIGKVYTGLGGVCFRENDMDGAEVFYRKALGVFEDLGQERGVARILVDLGAVFLVRKVTGKARGFFNKALVIFESLGDLEMIEKIEESLEKLS